MPRDKRGFCFWYSVGGSNPQGRDRQEKVRWTFEQGAVQADRVGRRKTADFAFVVLGKRCKAPDETEGAYVLLGSNPGGRRYKRLSARHQRCLTLDATVHWTFEQGAVQADRVGRRRTADFALISKGKICESPDESKYFLTKALLIRL